MITPTIYFVLLSIAVEGIKHEIKTTNTGKVDSWTYPDIYLQYTKLSAYGIHPEEEKRSVTFQVKACNDEFLLLSSARDLNSENFYELVFGGSGNTKIILRRKKGPYNDKVRENCLSCLSCDEYSSFIVKWPEQGVITVIMGSTVHVEWKDPNPIAVNGFGIMTGYGADGSWIFDDSKDVMCPCLCIYKKNVEYWSKQPSQNYSRKELEKMLAPKLEKMKQELRLNKSKLSFNRRKRTSARDNRKSSKQIGIMAVVFLAFVIGFVVFIDITAVRRVIHQVRQIRPQNQ